MIVSGIAQKNLSADDAQTFTTQLVKTGAFDLAGAASVICALDSDQTISDGTAVELMKSAAATLAVDKDAADTVTTFLTDNDTVLSHILDQLRIVNGDNFIHGIVGVDVGDLVDHIASDSNFIHGIVNVDVGDLFKDIASNNNYMHGIITITGNTVNINFGQVIGDIAAGGANSEAAQQALAEILKTLGVTQTGINAILTGIAGSILTNDQIAQLLSQLISSANMNLKNVVTIICALYNSRTITLQQAMTLLEKYISQMGNNSGSNGGNSGSTGSGNNGGSTGTEPTQSAGLLDTTNHNAYVSGRSATTFAPTGTLSRAEAAQLLYELMTEQAHKQYDRSDNDFSDVPAGQWYTVAVSTLANVGAITGCGDGTFQPGKSISRAEFVTILAGIYGVNTSKGMPFSDVDRSWYYDSVPRPTPTAGSAATRTAPSARTRPSPAPRRSSSSTACLAAAATCHLCRPMRRQRCTLRISRRAHGTTPTSSRHRSPTPIRSRTTVRNAGRRSPEPAMKQQTPGTFVPGVFCVLTADRA